MIDKKRYLGDGVYADICQWDGSLILTTENGIEVTNTIVIESSVWKALLNWVKGLTPTYTITGSTDDAKKTQGAPDLGWIEISGPKEVNTVSVYELCTEQDDCTCYAHLKDRLAAAEAALADQNEINKGAVRAAMDNANKLIAAEDLIQAAIAYREKWNAKEDGLWECHLALLRATAEYEAAAKGGRDE